MTSFEKLQKILREHYPSQEAVIARDTRLEQLDIDSLGIMELFFAIEDEFGISVPNEQRAMHTVGDLADYVDQLVAQQGVPAATVQHGNGAAEAGRAAP